MIQNLVLSAIKYQDTEKKSEVNIESRNENGALVLEVSGNSLSYNQSRVGDCVSDLKKRCHDHIPSKVNYRIGQRLERGC